MTVGSPVKDFYKNKNIFITGATGFLGIGLVEKLLRSCDVGTIYLLMRPKKGKEIQTRLEELTKNLVFENLQEASGDAPFKKLIAVAGDVGEDDLGLSQQDRQTLISNVHIVFHSAATLDFEAGLKPTVKTNLLGTRRIVQLASECRNIQALVHVSSAYVNSDKDNAEEIIYEAPGDVEKIIHLATTMSDSAVEELTPRLLGKHPNTYTITKAFAEHEVAKSSGKFPSAIVRPSMIVAAWKEPAPGWTISKNGPQGFIMGASKGVVRRLPVNKDLVYDYIPVDIVINELILAGWHAARTKSPETLVFHCTSSTTRPFTWSQVQDQMNKKLTDFPLKSAIWYPTMKLLPSLTLFRIASIFVHFIPAIFLDLLVRLGGGRAILVKLHTNVSRSLSRLAPFIFHEWFFDNKKAMDLYKSLSEEDKQTFNLDISTLEWDKFFTDLVKGVRRYLHNEHPKTLPAARRKNAILFVLNILVQLLVFSGIWWLVAFFAGTKMLSVFWVLPLSYALFSII